MKSFIQYSIASILAMGLVAAGIVYYHHRKLYPSTDDAYLQAHVVYIAPQVTGQVSQQYVDNYQYVHKGQLLFAMDPQPFQITLTSAQADLERAKLQLNASRSNVAVAESALHESQAKLYAIAKNTKRTLILVKKHYSSISSGDNATSDLQAAKAQVIAAKNRLTEAKRQQKVIQDGDIPRAKAMLEKAKLNLNYTKIYAPNSGYIADFTLQIGAKVTAYHPVFAVVENNDWWVDANFKETDLANLRPGQTATITLDMYPNHQFKGKVVAISRASGTTFSLMPPENATGNWVKVTQRYPVRIAIKPNNANYPFRVGASAEVTINTQSH